MSFTLASVQLPAQNYDFSTVAGLAGAFGWADGTNSAARFDSPTSVAVSGAGVLYVTDYFNYTIRSTSSNGTGWVVRTIAGLPGTFGSADGTNCAARFNPPTGIAADSLGNLFVADYWSHTIRCLTPSGTNWVVQTIAGLADNYGSDDGTNSQARFYYPRSVAVDPAGVVYVADTANSTIRQITPVGTNWVVSTIAGLALDYDSTDGTNSDARFYWPAGVALDSAGNLFVTDYRNNTIRKLTRSGADWVVSTIAGLAGTIGGNDGTNDQARFSAPAGIATATNGSVFVTDSLNDTLRKLAPVGTNWVVTTIGGQAGVSGSADGTNTTARFKGPQGIAVDSAGNLYIGDTANNTLRRGRLFTGDIEPPPPPTAPVIETAEQNNGEFVFTWSAVPGQAYQIQWLADLAEANWVNLGGVITATNMIMSASDPLGSDPQRFYRVELLP